MKNAIIVHGMPDKEEYYSSDFPSASNSHWVPWLQKQLMIHNIKTDTPEMPHAYKPEYDIWKGEFERFEITENTILVGHSCGAGFLVRWLSEHPNITVCKVVLVAPWLNTEHEHDLNFFEFEIDTAITMRQETTIFESTNDDDFVKKSIEYLKNALPNIQIRTFENCGHFCKNDLKTGVFPELLEHILK